MQLHGKNVKGVFKNLRLQRWTEGPPLPFSLNKIFREIIETTLEFGYFGIKSREVNYVATMIFREFL